MKKTELITNHYLTIISALDAKRVFTGQFKQIDKKGLITLCLCKTLTNALSCHDYVCCLFVNYEKPHLGG